MGRFSPQVPGFLWDTGPGKAGGLARGVESFMAARERKKAGERQEEEDARRKEVEELSLALQGIRRGEAPTQTVEREQPSVFEGVDPSRSIGEGEVRRSRRPGRMDVARGPGDNGFMRERPEEGSFASGPEGVAASLGELRQGGRPRMISPPGAFVPGVGFTDRALFENPAARIGTHREATTRERPDPRFEQLTDEFYRERPEDPQAQLSEALGRLRHLTPEQRDALVAGVPESVVFAGEEDEDMIRVAGRDFPNTPEGARAALEWEREMSEAGRDPRGPGGGRASFTEEELRQAGVSETQIPAAMRDPVLARQLVGYAVRPARPDGMSTGGRQRALAATRALEKLSEDATEIQEVYGGTSSGDRMLADLNRRRREILNLYGYDSVDDLRREVRSLGPDRARTEPGDHPEQDTSTPGAAAGGAEGAWKQRASELQEAGLDDDSIIDILRHEGLIP